MKRTSIAIVFLTLVATASSTEFTLHGRIESLRKGNMLTIVFEKKPSILKTPPAELTEATIKIPPSEADYYILDGDNKVIGTVRLVSAAYSSELKAKWRVVARYDLKKQKYRSQIRAGNPIVLVSVKKLPEETDLYYGEIKEKLKNQIISPVDKRIMVLVPAGKFIFGSNRGDKDEYPEQVASLDAFYIDKYEVSNRDYEKFVNITKSKAPLSWKKATYPPEAADCPVLVTYYEAKAYATWAGQRLPTEKEWEKAARGPGIVSDDENAKNQIYPWGNAFDQDRVNSIEFWSKNVMGMKIGPFFTINQKGLLPVYALEDAGASPYGAVNMAGNAKEWTDSWYQPYKGNTFINKKYGTQYKVVRGGAWYDDRLGVKATSREPGGIPNLYKDNLAGFRCVRDPAIVDSE